MPGRLLHRHPGNGLDRVGLHARVAPTANPDREILQGIDLTVGRDEVVAMLATGDAQLRQKLDAFRARQTEAARAMALPPRDPA